MRRVDTYCRVYDPGRVDCPMSLGDVEILARSPIFAPLDHEDLEVLAGIAHRRHYEKGQVIFFANEHPEGLHVVVSGAVKIFVLSPQSGREFVLTVEQPYNTVAELPSLDEDSYPASAQALKDSETLFLEQNAFTRVLSERPGIAMHLVRTLGRRLRRLVGLLEQLSFQEVIHRLAGYLLERSAGGLPFELETNGSVAARIGTVPELVSRNLSRLQQSGLIALSQRTVTELDQAALQELVTGAGR